MKKYALHLGLNVVDPEHYDGWDGKLDCCVKDSEFYKGLSEKAEFDKIIVLQNRAATSDAVIKNLTSYAEDLEKGDLFFFTYSGHGSQVRDINNDEAEDEFDETWCLFNRQLIDDELFEAFKAFNTGVKIFMVSDSCHSGSVSRAQPAFKIRKAPADISQRTILKNTSVYMPILNRSAVTRDAMGARVLQFSGCQDEQLSYEFGENGLFTTIFKKTLEGGENLSYASFFNVVAAEVPKVLEEATQPDVLVQNPNMFGYGNSEFEFSGEETFF
ncbi:caspase family protein [Muriicola sp. Z0-33]|uniref:caspase family protein n=1 Tax=Muriicola sp. Z0-33 TaxID=2816957 RepID=UPI002238E61C|nr:caspase family protein [Muriicola sp. Z0-33]MCW5517334.1 caspase family protein [Muriicola sp. Z0-33]